MSILKRIRQKAYYNLARRMVPTRQVAIPPWLAGRKGLFIYFDYEREFGGQNVGTDDAHLILILNKLNEYGIKTTWFTVGQIFRHYPQSVREITGRGHEVGSHTFGHIVPLNTRLNVLKKDFDAFLEASSSFVRPEGFHSPNGRWSLGSLREMIRHDYRYDIISCSAKNNGSPLIVTVPGGGQIIRFCTLGDDWPLHTSKAGTAEACEYYLGLLDKLTMGRIYGIGFHPWVMAGSETIMDAFCSLIQRVSATDEYCVDTAGAFATRIMMHNSTAHTG
ncbi:MAG: polysaccharide deacetylase family protein [Bacteroidales bacterium]|jgi:peptidoglycan/xylan/chitin deacetylase (PgdA/CDA1 family)|nr:polysaccharide deacetylase family protein [Bacteroidales bacterium]